jgi:hypothetical protein
MKPLLSLLRNGGSFVEAAAPSLRAKRKAATQGLVLAIGWGFFLPLGLLVAGEIDAGIRRINGRRYDSRT